MAYDETTIIGISTESFTAAADDTIDRTTEKYNRMKWAETQLWGVEIASVEDREYQVEAVVAYKVE